MPKHEPTENISITIPINMLAILDSYCVEADLNRSQTITRAVRLYLATKIAKTPAFWDEYYNKLQNEVKTDFGK